MREKSNIAALTSIRGLAAWWVVLFHFKERLPLGNLAPLGKFLAQGYLAVDLFFVLSGFVIFLNYGSYFEAMTRRSLAQFFTARLARIYPLHAFMMLAFLLNPLALIFSSSGHVDATRYDPVYFVLSLFLVQNWGFSLLLGWNIPAWSISTEAFAYLLFPAFAYFVCKSSPKPLTMAVMSAIFLALLAGTYYTTGEASIGDEIAKYGVLRCSLQFLVGASLCRIYVSAQMSSRWWPLVLFAGFGGLCATYAFTVAPDYLVMPAAFALLILALALADGRSVPVLKSSVLVFLGTISYSTYLVHYFVLDWVKFLLIHDDHPPLAVGIAYLATTLAASIVLYFYVEVPGRRVIAGRRPESGVPVFGSTK
jgi:peptidoglycan/LPS O-acetylase OafA/YrhL